MPKSKIETLMDALKKERPLTRDERNDIYNVLKQANEQDSLSVETIDGTLHTYVNRIHDYPTINVTWQPKDVNVEIDLVAATRDTSEPDSKLLKLYVWGDLSTDDVTEIKKMNTDEIADVTKTTAEYIKKEQ